MESIIKWQTGEPNTGGRFLIQTKYDSFQFDIYSSFIKQWATYTKNEIIAWCNLSDIEPYKEEKYEESKY